MIRVILLRNGLSPSDWGLVYTNSMNQLCPNEIQLKHLQRQCLCKETFLEANHVDA